MHERPEEEAVYNPLKHLTEAQFMALGGNAVVFVRPIRGEKLSQFLQADVEDDEELHLVMSGDGSPLLVADSQEAVADWLADKNYGIVALH
ncbi:MAG TPA: DUF1150 family protein [Devosia sp.]|nr:DUF1150 family protein [Devosia sp.]